MADLVAARYLVGFVRPASVPTLFHLATSVSIPLFEAELAAFARQAGAGPDKQIALILDHAGWHASRLACLTAPADPRPPASPLLAAVFARTAASGAFVAADQHALYKGHFQTIEELEEAQLAYCAHLQRQPERIRSTTMFH